VKTLRILALSLLLLGIIFVLVGALRSPLWRVEVHTDIKAPAAVIHPYIANFKHWSEWAGWNNSNDPQARFVYSGPASGIGAQCTWSGPQLGSGRAEITRADPEAGVWLDEAINSKALNAKSSLTYTTLSPGTTRVTWRQEGRLDGLMAGWLRGSVEAQLSTQFAQSLSALAAHISAVQKRFSLLPKIEAHGSVRAVTVARDWTTKVRLEEIPTQRRIGIGILTGLQGQVTYVEGGVWIATPQGGKVADLVTADPEGEATLMITAKVDRWRASAIPKEFRLKDLESVIAERVKVAGLPDDRPLPFRLRGSVINAVWHVDDGTRAINATGKPGKPARLLQTRPQVKADIVGFYAPKGWGLITPVDGAIYAHIVVPSERVSGHFDSGMIQSMAVLLLPDVEPANAAE
jgi:hypothetical protein